MTNLNVGDKVKVIAKNDLYYGEEGVVHARGLGGIVLIVKFSMCYHANFSEIHCSKLKLLK